MPNNPSKPSKKPLVAISSCLLGHSVRYDGAHQLSPRLIALLEPHFELRPFCPEVEIGLGVPRAKIQLLERAGSIVCVDQASLQIDYTERLKQCCDSQSDWLKKISGYVFKTKSPSCGLSKVKTLRNGIIQADGRGIFARQLVQMLPELPVLEDDQVDSRSRMSAFIDTVYQFDRKILR